jgi:hypothetical protein
MFGYDAGVLAGVQDTELFLSSIGHPERRSTVINLLAILSAVQLEVILLWLNGSMMACESISPPGTVPLVERISSVRTTHICQETCVSRQSPRGATHNTRLSSERKSGLKIRIFGPRNPLASSARVVRA